MRLTTLAAFAFAAIVLEISLRHVLTLHSLGGVSPSFTGALVVFIALFAPRAAALWSCWLIGVLMDLLPPPRAALIDVRLIGPHALGYAAAAYAVLQVRTMVFRRRALTVGVLTALAMTITALITIAIAIIRSWYPQEAALWEDLRPMGELLAGLGSAAYSGLLAIPLGWLLLQTAALWGFHPPSHRTGWR